MTWLRSQFPLQLGSLFALTAFTHISDTYTFLNGLYSLLPLILRYSFSSARNVFLSSLFSYSPLCCKTSLILSELGSVYMSLIPDVLLDFQAWGRGSPIWSHCTLYAVLSQRTVLYLALVMLPDPM